MNNDDKAMDKRASIHKQARIKRRLYEFTGLKESDPEYKTAMVMFTARSEGPDVDVITEITGYSRDFVQAIASRMRRSSVWTNSAVNCDHWEDDDAERALIAFAMDSLVAEGSFIREQHNGQYRYRLLGKRHKCRQHRSPRARKQL